MRKKMLYILPLCILAISLNNKIDIPAKVNKITSIETQAEVVLNSLRVVDSITTLNRGDIGYIAIQGRPRTKYILRTTYKVGNNVVSVTQWRRTNDKGEATFNWVVSEETDPGTHDIFIHDTNRSETLTLYHTVLP